jgi:hypothetical protein
MSTRARSIGGGLVKYHFLRIIDFWFEKFFFYLKLLKIEIFQKLFYDFYLVLNSTEIS